MWGNVKKEVTEKKRTCCALWAAAHDADNACGAPLAPAMSAVQRRTAPPRASEQSGGPYSALFASVTAPTPEAKSRWAGPIPSVRSLHYILLVR
jgi:hypothetical protein